MERLTFFFKSLTEALLFIKVLKEDQEINRKIVSFGFSVRPSICRSGETLDKEDRSSFSCIQSNYFHLDIRGLKAYVKQSGENSTSLAVNSSTLFFFYKNQVFSAQAGCS